MENLLTLKQICDKLQVSRSTVDRWRKSGLVCTKIGRSIRFNEDDLEKWLRKMNNDN